MADTEPSEFQPEIDQPGLRKLREAVANYAQEQLPGRATLRQDLFAGLNSALGSAPDGMANGLLAGVNPVYGLYASMAGPIAGGLFSSSQLMVITSTSAAALGAYQTLVSLPPEARENALFLMVVLVGIIQILAGLLRLGRLIRFVSYSVMTGFLTGIAVLMVLSQIPTVTGYEAEGNNRVSQAFNVLANLAEVDLLTVALAILTLVLLVILRRTWLDNYASLAAIAIPSLLVALFRLDGVEIVRDIGEIPGGIPELFVPSLAYLTPDVLSGAFAVALITLVQGAGVSQSVPNPDGSRISLSRDFTAQGIANLAAGFIRGVPVGGSLSATALSLVAGPRTRWAAILSGVWMALFVLVFPGLVEYVAMPALGALLINAGINTIKPSAIVAIWKTGWPSRLAIATTFLATLFLPIQAAVGIGVALSALLEVFEASSDISVVQLVKRPDGRIEEREAPRKLPSNEVTVLDVYGHLFYAGARTLERVLPRPENAHNPVVILRLRGRSSLGATLIDVLANYADRLREVGGRLYLTGISAGAYEQVVRTGRLRLSGPVRVYEASPTVGQSTHEAYEEARTWLVGHGEEGSDGAAAESARPNGRELEGET